jgi:cytochrome c-type biogenesis protein CcmF
MEIQYIGEQLVWGKIGNLLVMIAAVSALVSAISFYFSFRTNEQSWKRFSRGSFAIHTASIIGIFFLLFYLILHHRFEYYYVWEHSDTKMPLRYVLSCFWEGQEGSFLLWMFWHSVIGWVIIFTARQWEAGVMTIISLVQIFLASMIMGVVILNHKIGSNPFVLLREAPDFANLPFIKMPDYLSRINDGRGLNPLLQNYWMTIHPPTLFLGFALTVVPFAYAMSSLMNRKLSEWVKPALIWSVVGIMVLGTGILMGAAWAYESLSFGGFWAWDPVENASLVPWMTLTGGAHVMLIYVHRKKALLSAYILTVVTFFFILYSTFLTRSGILGDSSVHAFTDLGMSGQLVIYMLFFLLLAVFLIIRNKDVLFKSEVQKINYEVKPNEDITTIAARFQCSVNEIKRWNKLKSADVTDGQKITVYTGEDHYTSREFWMFIGMLILLIGALQITFTTSLPVYNKLIGDPIFHKKLAPPENPIDHYNKWQVPVAILLCFIMGAGQFFKYKLTDFSVFRKKLSLSLIVSLGLTGACAIILKAYPPHYYVLLFASIFAVVANFDYFVRSLNGRMANAGPSIAHIGVALILCGALISNSKKEIISRNVKNIDLGKDIPNKENVMIEQKIDTLPMGSYYVSYTGNEKKGVNVYYNIRYFKHDEQTGELKKQFDLQPLVQLNERMGNVAEPATKHFLTKDIYTHITYAELEEKKDDGDEFQKPKKHEIALGDTFMTSNSFVIFQGLNRNVDRSALSLGDSDIVVGAKLLVQDINRKLYSAEPLFVIKNYSVMTKEATVDELGLKFIFSKVDPATGKITVDAFEKKANRKDFVIMKAIIFPGINILWLGCLFLIAGSLISLRKRIKKFKAESKT